MKIHFLKDGIVVCRPSKRFNKSTNVGKLVTCTSCKKKMSELDFQRGANTK